MNIYSNIKNIVSRKSFSRQPAEDNASASPSYLQRLGNLQNIGFTPNHILDCGASVGYWSWEVGKLFAGTHIIAIEPNPKITPKTIELLSKLTPPAVVVECAIGDNNGIAYLNIWDNDETKMSGSSLKEHVHGDPRRKIEVKVKTLDSICDAHDVVPDLVKLDLQGYELAALRGATKVLESTEIFIIEFGCLPAYIDRTTPNDLMALMYEFDFCLYDVVDLIYRPYDNALTGGDFFFVKNSSKLKQYKGYN